MDSEPTLNELVARCKGSIYIEINPHKNLYMTAEKYLDDLACLESPPDIADTTRKAIISGDRIAELIFYPDTPIGSYHIVGTTLGWCVGMASRCCPAQREKPVDTD